MKALVTGGAGFIGSHLVERLLNDGHEVTALDRMGISYRNISHLLEARNLPLTSLSLDLGDFKFAKALNKFLSEKKIDWVFHLAGLADIVPSINDPAEYFKANVLGTINVLEASRQTDVKRFIYTSSSSIYGVPDSGDIPTSENAKIKPQYPYAETKYQGERWVSHYSQIYGLPAVSLRLFNVYGPRSRTSGVYGAVFGVFLAQKINGRPFTVVGDGLQSRDFTFVSDVCDAFVKAAESSITSEVFNVGSGKPQTILRLCELLGGDIIHIPKRPGEPDCTWADITKIRKMLNWQPKVSFERGVAIMFENIDYWKNAPVWTSESIREATKDWFAFLGKP